VGKLEEKRDALNVVLDAAKIHSQSLVTSLTEEFGMQKGFADARRSYIRKLDNALSEARSIRLDENATISQRVGDLDLEQATDLLLAVEDHIRSLRRRNRSEFK
jgi:hypothetical protein